MTRRVLAYTITDPGQPGGVEAVLRGVISACRRAGMSVHELRTDECPLHVRADPQRRLHRPSVLRALKTLLRVRPAVVNVHFVTAETVYFARLKRLFGYRLILSFHGSDLLLPGPETSALMPSILAAADAVTVVSHQMRRSMEAIPGARMDRVHVIPNGIDAGFWCPAPVPRPPGSTMLCAGRLEPVKGFDILIAAFAEIADALPDARLVIAGEGSEREALERQADDAGVSGRIDFAGFLDREALRAAYREADLFVMPSRSEGFPIALLEAMATGLPFVAADVGGVGEIATPQSGICVPPEDAAGLGDALAHVLGNSDLVQSGRAARERANEFSVERTERRYVGLIAGTR